MKGATDGRFATDGWTFCAWYTVWSEGSWTMNDDWTVRMGDSERRVGGHGSAADGRMKTCRFITQQYTTQQYTTQHTNTHA